MDNNTEPELPAFVFSDDDRSLHLVEESGKDTTIWRAFGLIALLSLGWIAAIVVVFLPVGLLVSYAIEVTGRI